MGWTSRVAAYLCAPWGLYDIPQGSSSFFVFFFDLEDDVLFFWEREWDVERL